MSASASLTRLCGCSPRTPGTCSASWSTLREWQTSCTLRHRNGMDWAPFVWVQNGGFPFEHAQMTNMNMQNPPVCVLFVLYASTSIDCRMKQPDTLVAPPQAAARMLARESRRKQWRPALTNFPTHATSNDQPEAIAKSISGPRQMCHASAVGALACHVFPAPGSAEAGKSGKHYSDAAFSAWNPLMPGCELKCRRQSS